MAEVKMNKGYLNTNQYKDNPKKPDFVGKVRVDVEFIRALTIAAKSGEAYVYLSGWSGQSQKDGTPYVYLSLEGQKFQAKGGGAFKKPAAPSAPAQREPVAAESPEATDATLDIMSMLD
jgi:hypothetical protein